MSKKITTACMALVALAAFALPATASASPVLTHPTGTTAPTGTLLTGTNIGNTLLKSGGAVFMECTKATLTGELTKTSGTTIEGNVTTATFTGTGGQDPAEAANMPECPNPFLGNLTVTTNGGGVDENTVAKGTPWCLKSTEVGKVTVRGGLCKEEARAIDFILKSTVSGNCVYSRTVAITGTYTTDTTGDAIFTLTSEGTQFTRTSGGFLCPAAITLEMKFTMETDAGSAVPVYIS